MTQGTNPVLDAGRPDPGTIRISDHYLVASGSGRIPSGTTASRAEEAVAPRAHVASAAPGGSPKVGLRAATDAAGQHSGGTHGGAVLGAVELVVHPGSGEGISS
jgi:hypothetical protein